MQYLSSLLNYVSSYSIYYGSKDDLPETLIFQNEQAPPVPDGRENQHRTESGAVDIGAFYLDRCGGFSLKCIKESEKGYQHNMKPLTTHRAAKYLPYCAMAVSAHDCDKSWLEGFNITRLNPSDYSNLTQNIAGLAANSHCFFDPESSLKISLFQKESTLYAAFGPKDSFLTETPPHEQSTVHRRQIYQIASNLLGGIPQAYQKACQFYENLERSFKPANKKIVLVGQSFGGSIAQYLGIKYLCETYVFNSLAIGPGLQREVGKENLAQAYKFITHVSVIGDFVSDNKWLALLDRIAMSLRIKTPGNFGNRFSFSYDGTDKHGKILGALYKHIHGSEFTNPKEFSNRAANPQRFAEV